jgi:DNA polymerase-1
MPSKEAVLLIDGDMVARTAVAAVNQAIEWEPFLWSYAVDLEEAFRVFNKAVTDLMDASHADRYVVALSSPRNFRKALYAPYKANRGPWPLGYAAFREMLHERLEAPEGTISSVKEKDGLEADDVLGIMATMEGLGSPVLPIIWSGDKDLLQVPGLHVDIEKGVYEVPVIEADRWHAYQTLTGDVTDGYPGCPGMGPVKAEKLLDAWGADPWKAIADAYTKAGKTQDEFLTQARVARILRASDYDFTTNTPILWSPPAPAEGPSTAQGPYGDGPVLFRR